MNTPDRIKKDQVVQSDDIQIVKEKVEEPKNELKFMDLEDFDSFGYLQELNRRFLHPLGLSLVLGYDEEDEEYEILGIVDNRENKSGMLFRNLNTESVKERYENIEQEIKNRKENRIQYFRFYEQPIGHELPNNIWDA